MTVDLACPECGRILGDHDSICSQSENGGR
jgi:hypothetical protein